MDMDKLTDRIMVTPYVYQRLGAIAARKSKFSRNGRLMRGYLLDDILIKLETIEDMDDFHSFTRTLRDDLKKSSVT